MAVHGHPLFWANKKQYPIWLKYEGIPEHERRALDSLEMITYSTSSHHVSSYDKMSPEELYKTLPVYINNYEKRTIKHCVDIVNHYKGKIQSWDIVNESAADFKQGVMDLSYPVCKSKKHGLVFSDYTFKVFKAIESYIDKQSLMNINDYDVSDNYVKQVEDLVKRGARIDVVGSQMHLFKPQECLDIAAGKRIDPTHRLVDPVPTRAYFAKFGKLGIPVCLSEITITSAGLGHRGEMIQAIISRNLYRLWFSLPEMMGITWWNIVDDCGSLTETNISGLFYRNMKPKAAYYALDQLINHEWRTNLELKPDHKGNISWRGFKGTYNISWIDPSGKSHNETIVVK